MQVLGTLFIISAASGAGKTSLVKALLAQDDQLKLSISHTTRAMRLGEVNGVDYHFVQEHEFLAMLENTAFLESAHVHGARYGTAQAMVNAELNAGFDVILEIDWQGAEQVRRIFKDSVSLFVLPPSLNILKERLTARGQDSAETIQKRLAAARSEMAQLGSYDYVTINDQFEMALKDIQSIIRAERLKVSKQIKRNADLIQTLT